MKTTLKDLKATKATVKKTSYGDIKSASPYSVWLQAGISLETGEIITDIFPSCNNYVVYSADYETFWYSDKCINVAQLRQIAQAYLDMRRAGFDRYCSREAVKDTAKYLL